MIIDVAQLILFGIGIIAVISVISGLFFAYGKGPKSLFTNNPIPQVNTDDFMLALSYTVNSPIEQGGSITPLQNGNGFYPVLIEEIKKAKKNINFTVYIWEDGKISQQIVSALVAKQKEGVQVRILIDFVGAHGASRAMFKELVDAGGRVERFRTLQFGKLTRFHRRTHRRSIVIDGIVGFTGGMAVKDVWAGNARNPDEWRDIMFRMTGPMARNLQSAFTDLWTGATGEILFGSGIYPSHVPEENTNVKFIHLVSSPNDSLTLTKFMILSMMAAKEKLYITTPYFVPDKYTLDTIIERAKAGVDVRLILPNAHIDNKTVRWNAQNYYHDLLAAGVKIYEYQPTFIHSKYFVVDGQWSVIGSSNQNYRSRYLDEENTFGILNMEFSQKMESVFLDDLKLSKEITVRTWRKRGLLLRVITFLSLVIKEQS